MMFDLSNIKKADLLARHYYGNMFELQNGIGSVSDLFRILETFSCNVENTTNKILFRGESKEYSYPGITSFTRYCLSENISPTPFLPLHDGKHLITCLTKEEVDLVDNFRASAPNNDIFHKLSNSNERYPDWFAFAQHQGIPTRLLDVTKNPLVALYFACKSSPDEDGYLFLYFEAWDPLKGNKPIDDFEDFFDIALDGKLVAYKKADQLDEYFKNNIPRIMQSYMIYECPILNDRLNAQQGVFLWGHDPFKSLNTQNIIIKIKGSRKTKILNELHQIGINEEGLKLT